MEYGEENQQNERLDGGRTVTVMPNGERVVGGGVMTRGIANKFFALRGDNLLNAFEMIKHHQVNQEIDGDLLGRWVLTSISYWNRDSEKLVLLCTKCILICKFDFVAMKMGMIQRVNLSQIQVITKGKLEYPTNSVLSSRLYDGVRLSWGTMEERPWWQKWNPLNSNIPFVTFTSHPVLSLPEVESRHFYDVDVFYSSLRDALSDRPGLSFYENLPIMIESYAGVASFVSNQSRLGFSRERGGVSF